MENIFNKCESSSLGCDKSQKGNLLTEDKVVTISIDEITIPEIHLNLYDSQNKFDKLQELK